MRANRQEEGKEETLMGQKETAKTGQKAPESGIYRYSGRSTELALSKNDVVPPNTKGHLQKVTLVRPTHGGN